MRLTTDTFEVSEDFVKWALELAIKAVYKNRLEKYKDSNDLTINAIHVRYDKMWEYIDAMLDCWCLSMDPYDDVDWRFGEDEKSYEEIWKEEIYPELDEDEQKEYGEEYENTENRGEKEDKIEERCMDNNYRYDSSYEIAVADPFTSSY